MPIPIFLGIFLAIFEAAAFGIGFDIVFLDLGGAIAFFFFVIIFLF